MKPIKELQTELSDSANIFLEGGIQTALMVVAEHVERLERMVVDLAGGAHVRIEGERLFSTEIRNQPVDWPDLRDLIRELHA